jgi:hypothetical protein
VWPNVQKRAVEARECFPSLGGLRKFVYLSGGRDDFKLYGYYIQSKAVYGHESSRVKHFLVFGVELKSMRMFFIDVDNK